jgi:hypothetical protein
VGGSRTLWGGVWCIATIVAVSPAVAQSLSLHARGEVSVAYTDNLYGTPATPVVGRAGPLQIWFLAVAPGLELYRDEAKALYLVTYTHPFTLYFGRFDARTQSDLLSAQGIFSLSESDELTLVLDAAQTSSALAALQSAPGSDGPQLGGHDTLLSASGSELWRHDLSDSWRQTQSLSVGALQPQSSALPQPARWDATAGWMLEYLTDRNAWGLELQSTWFLVGQSRQPGTVGVSQSTQQEVLLRGGLQWRRDLSEEFSSVAAGGAVLATQLGGKTMAEPVWGAIIAWNRQAAHAELGYQRTVLPSLMTGQIMRADTVQLAAQWPLLSDSGLYLGTEHRLTANRVLSTDNDNGSTHFKLWSSSISAGWLAAEPYPTVQVSYEHFKQFDVPEASVLLPQFSRNTVMLTLSSRWPARDVQPVPTASPLRVDEQDRDPRVPALGRAPAAVLTDDDDSQVGTDAGDR